LKDVGLTYPQYLVMLVLWERDRQTVNELGRTLHLDSGTLTPLLKRLEKMGLIGRQRDPEDERKVVISLTSEGRSTQTKVRDFPGTIFRALGMSRKQAVEVQRAVLSARDHVRAYRRQHQQGLKRND